MNDATAKIESIIDSVLYLEKEGQDINDLILEETRDLPLEAIKRVCEGANVKKFAQLMASGEDKTSEFPVADYKKIIKKNLEKDAQTKTNILEKKACENSFDFYTRKEKLGLQKEASFREQVSALEKTPETQKTLEKRLMKEASLRKMRLETVEEMMEYLLEKSAEKVNKIKTKLYLNKEACYYVYDNLYSKYGDSSGPLLEMISMSTKVPVKSLNKMAMFDNDNEHVKQAEEIINILGILHRAGKVHAQLKKEAETKEAVWWRALKGIGKATAGTAAANKMTGTGSDSKKNSEPEKKDGPIKSTIKNTLGGTLGGAFGAGQIATESGKKILGPVKGIIENYAKNMPKPDASKKEEGKEVSLALQQKAIFENLVKNDDYLQGKDPVALANLYKSMIQFAPNVAANENVAKAYLREASTEDVLSPLTVSQLLKLERMLTKDDPVAFKD